MDRLKSLDLTIELLTRGTLDAVSCGAFSDLYPNDFPFNGTDLVLTTALDAQVGSFDAAFRIFSALLPHWAIYSLKFWRDAEAPAHCEIWGTHEDRQDGKRRHKARDGRFDAEAANIGTALLLATFKAYREQLFQEALKAGGAA